MENYTFNNSKASPHKEYFSGANVRVYFGDVWVDQMASLSFSLREQVAPIYGFRSHTFDRVSRGNRYVEGEFTLNFTENGYLQTILDRIASGMEKESIALSENQKETNYLRNLSEEQNIKDLLELDGLTYEGQIGALKDSFWGRTRNTTIASSESKEQDVYYYSKRANLDSVLKEHGFNILIDYSPDANEKDFLDCINGIKSEKSFYQSYRTIIGVHIMGEEQQIINNGSVLQVRYNFIARDLDGDATKPSLWSNYRNTDPSVVKWKSVANIERDPVQKRTDGPYRERI